MIRCIKFANSPLERIGLLICLVDYKIHRDTSDCPQTHPYASLSALRPTCQTNAVYCLNTVSSVWESCFTTLWLSSCPVVSDSLRPHGLQHTRLLCPSLSPGVCSNSCPELVMPSSYLILWCPLLLLPSIFPSFRDFSNESAVRIRWPKF